MHGDILAYNAKISKAVNNLTSFSLASALVCLFFFFPHLLCFSQKSVRPINGPRSERNVTDELGRRQGVWRYYYQDGDLREEINYVNNLQEGLNTKYFHGKKTQVECNYLGGRKDGEYKRYFLSGQTAVEGKYVFGQRDGQWIEYYEDGQTKSERGYKRGVKDGNWKRYDRKGTLVSDVTYKKGVDVNAAPPAPKAKPASNKPSAGKSKNYKITGGKQDTSKVK